MTRSLCTSKQGNPLVCYSTQVTQLSWKVYIWKGLREKEKRKPLKGCSTQCNVYPLKLVVVASLAYSKCHIKGNIVNHVLPSKIRDVLNTSNFHSHVYFLILQPQENYPLSCGSTNQKRIRIKVSLTLLQSKMIFILLASCCQMRQLCMYLYVRNRSLDILGSIIVPLV